METRQIIFLNDKIIKVMVVRRIKLYSDKEEVLDKIRASKIKEWIKKIPRRKDMNIFANKEKLEKMWEDKVASRFKKQ